jgi:hypothetical protein
MAKREDPLKDSWAYQESYQEGVRRAHLAELQRQRRMIEYFVKLYFPNNIEMAKERINAIDDPDVLQEIILELIRVEADFRSQMEEAARQILSK